ncbi:PAS domain-containing sensor histidine kinase [Ancylomarina salipaludis]|uniref:histidine kinase n=1 Tax=Ancylomarina salipaludis TaxID=2501299 RepID=A0A4Q1JIX0_9BACT|nr:HAMP domain-containing sensor histidine kinase [Ancylomarina salipaludis]RXQ88045.1 PAS domain-containing sensor histidine kinase [Ancylomarina salipaludis]
MKPQAKSNKGAVDLLAKANIDPSVINLIEEKHRRIEEVLEHERQLYLDLANSQPTGVYRLRISNYKKIDETRFHSTTDAPYIIEFANTRFCEILNVCFEQFQRDPGIINNLVFESDRERFIQKNIEANRNLNPFIWEGRLLVSNEIIWVHFESTPRLLANGDVVWTGVLFDITKRKKKQQDIQEKNKQLHILNAQKDKFFSIIAHDLKSPFNAIVGFTKILIEEIKLKNIEGIEKYAEIVLDSSNLAFDLLTNLMDWARSQTGRMVYKPVAFDFLDLTKETVSVFACIAKGKNIRINMDFDSKLPVCADYSMISTVLRNLISNAIKFTRSGGSVSVKAEQLAHHLKVIVKDTGVGMSEDVIPKLFRIDEKHSTSGTQDEQGTGLGLILCKDFVEKHGGQIWVESLKDVGSSFIFTLKTLSL